MCSGNCGIYFFVTCVTGLVRKVGWQDRIHFESERPNSIFLIVLENSGNLLGRSVCPCKCVCLTEQVCLLDLRTQVRTDLGDLAS